MLSKLISSPVRLMLLLLPHSHAVSTVVRLNYTSYRGTVLSHGVTQWLGMRYAAPPVGDSRFKEPQDPLIQQGVVDADTYGPYCLSTAQGPPNSQTDEDCLFLNIWGPTSALQASRLPVYVFIQGGGFNSNAKAYNGTGLVEASELNIIVVNFGYRVGPYGFLASQEILANGSLNNGLKDQRKALQWVQSYISLFGGDPKHVTLGGASAGGQSVDLHVTAYGGRDDGLFHATAAESQSFSALRTVGESQFAYNNLVIRTGCASSQDTLACLRSLSAAAIQEQNYNTPFPGAQTPPLFMYGPVLDFDFISDYTYRCYADGNFLKLPAIAGDDTNEGTVFTNVSTNSIGESDTFVHSQFPSLTLEQLKKWNELYPVNSTEQYPHTGRFWQEVSKGYGEMRYICPGIYISGIQAKMGIPNWNYRWDVVDPEAAREGYGVTHTVELQAIWGPEYTNGEAPQSYKPGGVNHAIVPVVQAYWTSFIRSFDPNKYRLPGTPKWEAWAREQSPRRIRFQTSETMMEDVPRDQRRRCDWLSSIGVSIGQ